MGYFKLHIGYNRLRLSSLSRKNYYVIYILLICGYPQSSSGSRHISTWVIGSMISKALISGGSIALSICPCFLSTISRTISSYSLTISAVAQAVIFRPTTELRIFLGNPPKNAPETNTFVSITIRLPFSFMYFFRNLSSFLYVKDKKLRPTEWKMITPLSLLRCIQLGLSIADLDLLSIGLINDMYAESRNDSCSYAVLGTQEGMDCF